MDALAQAAQVPLVGVGDHRGSVDARRILGPGAGGKLPVTRAVPWARGRVKWGQ